MKNIFTCILLFCVLSAIDLHAYSEKNLLMQSISFEDLKESLIMDQKWVPYPDYNDRSAWNKLLGSDRVTIILNGEKYLNHEWLVVKATDYLEYERTGNRKIMENPLSQNNTAIVSLLMAELAEGKGRFLDQLINGVYHSCEMTSWVLSAHLTAQETKRILPDYKEHVIDLGSGNLSSALAWVYYFFHGEFDKVDPAISERLFHEIKTRTMDTYMEKDHFWWMAFNLKPGGMVNNWNPWCNSNVLQCFMLLESDRDRLAEAVYRTMMSVDKFINYTHSDGACEEGPTYWGHAAGKMYDYLQNLSDLTDKKVTIFNEPLIRNMGEYISRAYVGDSWVVNFADALARGSLDGQIIYRYGKAVGSDEMMHFAAYLQQGKEFKFSPSIDVFRMLQNLQYRDELAQTKPSHNTPEYTWYPETEFCFVKGSGDLFFAAKGGYNNESHNHNDIGTFSLYLDNTPVFIDAGVGTYTRQTFSSERYSIWTMQSNYHSLPMINGVPQSFGSEYKSEGASFDKSSKIFKLNIAKAYPEEAKVKQWERTYKVGDKKLTVTDSFELSEAVNNNIVNFLTWGNVDISKAGFVQIAVEGKTVQLEYDKNQFSPSVEPITLTDQRLSDVWGNTIYRVSLKSNDITKKGKYTFSIKKLQ